MNGKEFKKALDNIVKEKDIDPEVVYSAMELALTSAYKKNFNSKTNVKVLFDRETGEIKVYSFLTVVDDDKKTKEDPEVDRYHVITEQLERLNAELDEISKAKDRAFGAKRLKLMDEEIAKTNEIIKKNEGSTHPRNVAAGTVRTLTADEGKLSHLDFVAFELIDSNKDWNSKLEQLEFLENNKFSVVEHSFVGFVDHRIDQRHQPD